MATPIDRLPKKDKGPNPTKTTKANYVGIKYANEKGSISMGHIHEKGDVTSGVMLQTPDANHSLTLDIDGKRKGWTIATSPGNFSVKAGMANTEAADTLTLEAEKGNILITATNGKIRMKATDIEMVATGKGTDTGNISLTATETVKIDSKKFVATASSYYKICTTGIGEITANSILNIYSSIWSAVGDAVFGKDSKIGGKRTATKENQTVAPTTLARYDR